MGSEMCIRDRRNNSAKVSVARLIDVQQSGTTAVIASSSQKKKSRRVLTENDTGSVSTLATAVTARESSVSTRIPSNTRMMQLTLDVQQPNSSNELALTVAIADMILQNVMCHSQLVWCAVRQQSRLVI